MTILEMWEALPDGTKEEYKETLNPYTKYVVALDIEIYKKKKGRSKARVKYLVETAYTEYKTREEFKNNPVYVKQPGRKPDEEERSFNVMTDPHEFGSMLEKIEARRK